MKLVYCFLFTFCFFIAVAQPKFILKGKVYFENFPLQKIEIINLETETVTLTDSNGSFETEISLGSKLIIGSSTYNYRTIIIKKEDIENNHFKVLLTKKIEELDEVLITNIKLPKIKIDQATIDDRQLQKANAFPNSINNQQLVPNGANLIRLGSDIGKFFKTLFNIQPKKPKEILPEIDVKNYIKKNLKPNYLTETLELNPEQINLFLQFCQADANFESAFRADNVLLVMDFLQKKSKIFKEFTK